MIAFELAERTPDRAKAIVDAAFERGLLLLACGLYGNVIRLLPPLTIADDELEDGLRLLDEAARRRGVSDVPDIRLRGLRKSYGDVAAVDGIDLDVARGEFFTMLGPSGSGKTTTLRMIAGFERPDAGAIELDGRTSRRCRRTTARSTPSSRTTRSSRT